MEGCSRSANCRIKIPAIFRENTWNVFPRMSKIVFIYYTISRETPNDVVREPCLGNTRQKHGLYLHKLK